MKRADHTSRRQGETRLPNTVPDSDDTITVSEAMRRVGYKDRKSFLATVRAKGLPLLYLNPRVIRIRRSDWSEWMDRRATSFSGLRH